MTKTLVAQLIEATAATIVAHAEELTALDRAVGDGDHGINMKRGFEALTATLPEVAELPLGQAMQKAGMTLVMKVGGASGPLYGSLLIGMAKVSPDTPQSLEEVTRLAAAGVEAVKQRGKVQGGEKTMLDLLIPVQEALSAAAPGEACAAARAAADRAAEEMKPMKATKGRAAFLGERSIGHMDPGARSSQLLVHAICDVIEGKSA